jgi:hypothetical protein
MITEAVGMTDETLNGEDLISESADLSSQRDELDERASHEAERFADVLETLDAHRDAIVDQVDDAELTSLVEVSGLLRHTYQSVRPDPDYIARSRAKIMLAMEPEPELIVYQPDPKMPFYRRWNVLTPIASAAAAAAAAFAIVIGLGGPAATTITPAIVSPAPAPSPVDDSDAAPRPPASTTEPASATENDATQIVDQAVTELVTALQAIVNQADAGEPIDPGLFRTITEGTATVATLIETDPDSIDRLSVLSYLVTSAEGRDTLSRVVLDPLFNPALAAAQNATQDAVIVASRYFVAAQSQ